MISNPEIKALACVMIARYGGDAADEAGRRAERFEGHGDAVGQALWRRVGHAVDDLTAATAVERMEVN